ncbi:MAG: lipocalin family protein [Bacteroidota bacterium]
MNTNKIFFLCVVCLISLLACSGENTNHRIVGSWQGTSWKVKGQPSGRDASEVVFEFKADDAYTAAFGPQKETGTYRLVENKLYTTANGQAEKMVQITLAAVDTLVMDMNRAGTLEELVLVKK